MSISKNITDKIDKLINDTTEVSDIEKNVTQKNITQRNINICPDGYQWCDKTKKCVLIGTGDRNGPRQKRFIESLISGNIVGSGQTRVVGIKQGEIEVLKNKMPNKKTKFNKLLGIYMVNED